MNNKQISQPVCIVANGDFPTNKIPLELIKRSKTIIACDGAVDTIIKEGYIPDIIIGDLDSISEKSKVAFSNRIIEIEDQSENDLRKALNYVENKNIDNISIIGASGKREDHLIGNVFSLLNYKNLNIKLFTDTGVFSCIHTSKKIQSFKGQQVSIFTSDITIKITSNNLKYNFNNNKISSLFCGTLNESVGDFFKLEINHGSLLIFQGYK